MHSQLASETYVVPEHTLLPRVVTVGGERADLLPRHYRLRRRSLLSGASKQAGGSSRRLLRLPSAVFGRSVQEAATQRRGLRDG